MVREVRRRFRTTADHSDKGVGVGDSPLLSPPALMAFLLAAANEAVGEEYPMLVRAELTVLAPVLAGAELEVYAFSDFPGKARAEAYVAGHRVAELVAEYVRAPLDRLVEAALR